MLTSCILNDNNLLENLNAWSFLEPFFKFFFSSVAGLCQSHEMFCRIRSGLGNISWYVGLPAVNCGKPIVGDGVHVRHTGEDYSFGARVRLSCWSSGARLNVDSNALCLKSGRWSFYPVEPRCTGKAFVVAVACLGWELHAFWGYLAYTCVLAM